MRLFIAEKKSMAEDISKCLPGPHTKKGGYIETGGGIVTWAFGHMLRQAEPEEYDAKYKSWNIADLPILPKEWQLIIIASKAAQLKVIKTLLKDATEVINAGDRGREGQLLIDEILDYFRYKKKVLRICLSALDEVSVKRGLADLQDNKNFIGQKNAALARGIGDWLIGMNLTRGYTISAQKNGHSGVLPVGRVKTPTIALAVRREEEIKNFKPADYYILKVNFNHKNGDFQTVWQPKTAQAGLDSERRLIEKSEVVNLIKRLENSKNPPIIEQCEKSQKKETHSLPYSLSALQIEAGRQFGYSPQKVLETAQKLYESKLTTYPRSDCDYLPISQLVDAKVIISNLQKSGQSELSNWAKKADLTIKSRAWDDKKLTEHHAIIPTMMACNFDNLSEEEKNIYFLIAQSYIAQFYPVHVYDHTKITVDFAGEIFTVSGRVVIEDGWRTLFRKTNEKPAANKDESDEVDRLPSVAKGDALKYLNSRITDKVTKPPTRFTPSTLLEAMKNIHFYVKNPDLKKQLKDGGGIGTEATRATIIDEIIKKGLLREEKKYLVPSGQANLLISILPDELTYPDETARWEINLEKIVNGTMTLNDFIKEQESFVTNLCQKLKTGAINIASAQDTGGIECPICKKGVLRKKKGPFGLFWGCSAHPDCKATFEDDKDKPVIIKCPECNQNFLRKRKGAKGDFWGCAGYPDCKAGFEDKKGKPVLEKKSSGSKK